MKNSGLGGVMLHKSVKKCVSMWICVCPLMVDDFKLNVIIIVWEDWFILIAVTNVRTFTSTSI